MLPSFDLTRWFPFLRGKTNRRSFIAITTMHVVVCAALFAWMWIGDALGLLHVFVPVGGVLVLAAYVGYTELRRRRYLRIQDERNQYAQFVLEALEMGIPIPPYFLHLHPFNTISQLNVSDLSGAMDDTEEVIANATSPIGHTIALGLSNENRFGPGRLRSTDDKWQSHVELLAEKCERIFLIPSTQLGIRWEIDLVRARGWLRKTVFVMPPDSASVNMRRIWMEIREDLARSALKLPRYDGTGMLFVMSDEGTCKARLDFPQRNTKRLERKIAAFVRDLSE
jgi:hypothetical protein